MFDIKYFNLFISITVVLFFFNDISSSSNKKKYNEMFTNDYNIINYHNITQKQKENMLYSLRDEVNDSNFILYWVNKMIYI